MSDEKAELTAAAIVTALRVALERLARSEKDEPSAGAFGRALRHLGDGAGL